MSTEPQDNTQPTGDDPKKKDGGATTQGNTQPTGDGNTQPTGDGDKK
jgi:hypothetical protein